MQKKILTLLLLWSALGICQTNGNEIASEGTAKMKLKPDVAYLKITVQKRNETEKTAIKELNEEVEKLQVMLTRLGFTTNHIKIQGYSVEDENRFSSEGRKMFAASNTLAIQFGLDRKVINAFYQELQSGNFTDLNVEFEAQISEALEKSTRQKLVQLAISDAKANAENIAASLDVKLGHVKQATKGYLNQMYPIAVASLKTAKENIKGSGPMPAGPKTSFDQFELEERELEESVTVVYEIVKN